jgi:predicted RNase H-like nuclease (RuvC/YqgF family)
MPLDQDKPENRIKKLEEEVNKLERELKALKNITIENLNDRVYRLEQIHKK